MAASRQRGALIAVLLGFFIVMLDATIVNVALADIGTDLDAPMASLQWVVDSYTLVFAAFLLTSGAACDRLGARDVYLLGLLLFGVLSVVCALAPTGGALVAARAAQGAGASAVVPGSLALLAVIYTEPDARSRAIGLWGGAGGIAAAVGPVLGGVLVSWIGWRAVFWVNIPIIAVACRLTLRSLPAPAARHGRAIDPLGQLLSVLGLAALTYGMIAGGESGLGSASAAAICCGASTTPSRGSTRITLMCGLSSHAPKSRLRRLSKPRRLRTAPAEPAILAYHVHPTGNLQRP